MVILGLRYPSDADIVRSKNGRIIAITRPQHIADNTDITEAQQSKIIPDIVVINGGTLEQLRAIAEALWNDIAAGTPKNSYSTA